MRNILAASVLLVAVIAFATSLHAQNPSWCAIMDNDGNLQCNYFTEQQCLQTLSGIGGRCVLNPAGNAPQSNPYPPTSENAQGLLQLQMQNPGPPPGLGAVPPPPNN